ncbi:hypothetical protein [Streptomyces orinoci]|uniref:Uncharacterized protein n=1 Tax=Streptomyces orinoci TaxID=67339 RepID=A0ABV3K7P6_STRON|nr:hypothetical protein [Streptomyces orinoci]
MTALLRPGLVLLAALHSVLGGWALFLPQSFYRDFPAPGHAWVAMFPPYNEHLLRDYGGLNLAFALIFGACAIRPERLVVRVSLLGYECYALPHLLFHLGHLRHFRAADAVGQTASLTLTAIAPPLLLTLSYAGATRPMADNR